MRDIKRIPVILDYLKEYWERYPDLRFFQMLSSIQLKDPIPDLFYYEDDKLIKSLEELSHEK